MTTKRSAPLAAAASSTRRAFLKFGALAAAPLAAAAPALAGAGDDTADRLARLEDKESIRALHATLLRAINTGDPAAARALFADPAKAAFDETVRHIALDSSPATRGSSPAQRGVSRGPQDKTRSVLNGERPSGFREGRTTRSVVEGADAPRSSKTSLNNSSPVYGGGGPSKTVEGAAASQPSEGVHITLAEDRQTATLAAACTVHTETPIDSDCTLVQMARLQGEGFVRYAASRTLEARFVKVEGAWKVEGVGWAMDSRV